MTRKTIADLEGQLSQVEKVLSNERELKKELLQKFDTLSKKVGLLEDDAPCFQEAHLGLRKAYEKVSDLRLQMRGGDVKVQHCYQCHASNPIELGKMEPLEAFNNLSAYLEAFWHSAQDKVKVEKSNNNFGNY